MGKKILKRKKCLLKNGKFIFLKRFVKKWEKPKNGKKVSSYWFVKKWANC